MHAQPGTRLEQNISGMLDGQNGGVRIFPSEIPRKSAANCSVHDSIAVRSRTQATFDCRPSVQPYIKLHGSTNWNHDERRTYPHHGGQKAASINQFPILTLGSPSIPQQAHATATPAYGIGTASVMHNITCVGESWKT